MASPPLVAGQLALRAVAPAASSDGPSGATPTPADPALANFHPAVAEWFRRRFADGPTTPQREGWPHIQSGRHTLISAPTGTGKTLAGYLAAIDALARKGQDLRDETAVLYV